jgi:hypothetical protein
LCRGSMKRPPRVVRLQKPQREVVNWDSLSI